MSQGLQNIPVETYVLAGIFKHGYDGYEESSIFVTPNTFNDGSHQAIYKCMEKMVSENPDVVFDIPSLLTCAKDLGFDFLTKPNEIKHLKTISEIPVSLSNLRQFAGRLRKTEIRRNLALIVEAARSDLETEPDTSSVERILSLVEEPLFEYINSLQQDNSDQINIGDGWEDWVDSLASNPRDYVGIPTGLDGFDTAIGGGFRRRAVSMIGARPKVGKSQTAMFFALNCIKHKVPVLLVDTEMDKDDFRPRIAANISGIPISVIETGKFGLNTKQHKQLREIGQYLRGGSFTYIAAKGRPFEEVIGRIRRWIRRDVGCDEAGKTKDCLIVYDYFKLLSDDDMNKALQEYHILGFQMTTLHNFANRYDVPIVSFTQLNRDGITKESTDAVSGSDRIIWLASNFSILKEKTPEDINECGIKHGNRKLITLASRHGPGMSANDYQNLTIEGSTARVIPGKMKSQLQTMDDDEPTVTEQDIPF